MEVINARMDRMLDIKILNIHLISTIGVKPTPKNRFAWEKF